MAPTKTSDVLKTLPHNELLSLIEVLKTGGSLSVYAHYFILNLHNWYQKLGSHEAYPLNQIEVFVPVAGIQNGTFLCFDKTGKYSETSDYFYFFTIQSSCAELKECLQETNRIDWNSNPIFGAVHSKHLPTLRSVLSEKNIKIASEVLLNYYEASKDVVNSYDTKIPDGLELKRLDESYASVVDECWRFRNKNSSNAIGVSLQLNGGLGLFDKTQSKLLGWVTTNEQLALGLLQIVEGEKRKGYARILVKQYCKKFVADDRGLLPLTFVVKRNLASVNLFVDLNFTVIGECYWVSTGNSSFN